MSMDRYLTAVIALLMVWLLVGAWRLRRRRAAPGAAAAAAFQQLLNDERRQAVQIILEKRAEAQDPEDRDELPHRPPTAGSAGEAR